MKPLYALAMVAFAFAPWGAQAQESSNRVAANTAWSVFVEANPKECWVVSTPVESVNTRDGRTVAVRRGKILLMVSWRPADGVKGEVYFTGGYPFDPNTPVVLSVGGQKFEFFTKGEDAWPATPEDDQKIIAAMKRGSEAVVVGKSARGTRTEDKFSLLGFTAAVQEAEKRCGG